MFCSVPPFLYLTWKYFLLSSFFFPFHSLAYVILFSNMPGIALKLFYMDFRFMTGLCFVCFQHGKYLIFSMFCTSTSLLDLAYLGILALRKCAMCFCPEMGIMGKIPLSYFSTWVHELQRVPLQWYATLVCVQIYRGAPWLGTTLK